jgi:hypothetical protein
MLCPKKMQTIHFVEHKNIDKVKWDNCIKNAFNGNAYAWSWYLDIVHPNWDALIDEDYRTVFPLTGKKKHGIWYLFQPFYAQQLGVFSQNWLNENIIESFIHKIPDQYRFAEIRLNIHNKVPENLGVVAWHRNMELDLVQSYDKIAENYHSNTKRNLKKAQQAKLKIIKNSNPDTIIELFRANRGRTVSHWNDQEYSRLKYLTQIALSRNQATVLGVSDESNEICAGAIFIQSNNKIIFLFSGANQTAHKKHAITFLIDYMIQKNAQTPLIFDFEGSDNKNLARFYKGFGSSEVFYPSIKINRLSFLGRIALRIIKRK